MAREAKIERNYQQCVAFRRWPWAAFHQTERQLSTVRGISALALGCLPSDRAAMLGGVEVPFSRREDLIQTDGTLLCIQRPGAGSPMDLLQTGLRAERISTGGRILGGWRRGVCAAVHAPVVVRASPPLVALPSKPESSTILLSEAFQAKNAMPSARRLSRKEKICEKRNSSTVTSLFCL
jgi:hypothetical protein